MTAKGVWQPSASELSLRASRLQGFGEQRELSKVLIFQEFLLPKAGPRKVCTPMRGEVGINPASELHGRCPLQPRVGLTQEESTQKSVSRAEFTSPVCLQNPKWRA